MLFNPSPPRVREGWGKTRVRECEGAQPRSPFSRSKASIHCASSSLKAGGGESRR